ncbi:uncharacterized protein LOC116805489 [Drosophila grimshawi]|uniref:uncharacterized protein LOC116805489 n=1 Tax=Drosophila grimshawi TaxID=7222 RepID=UPI000C86FD6E|nr:uncharacterized protein LOC116805489 [Drosophila grimshawi]
MNSRMANNVQAEVDNLPADGQNLGSINNDSMAKLQNIELKQKQAKLKQELNSLKLQLTALEIEIDYAEENVKNRKNRQKTCVNQNIKAEFLNAAQEALNSQTSRTFPDRFLAQIFKPFAEDANFMDHCVHFDVELAYIMDKLRMQACEAHEPRVREVINKKLPQCRSKLVAKYEARHSKMEEMQQSTMLLLKRKCFELLQQLLNDSCKNQNYIIPYIKELETLYEQQTQDF